ncbi:Spy/CpxP family protein refolding chaperone [Aquincola sp. MAHUQ-54]|uniref:Spy/CpxP family protein refolding chaperone n=1 Tax=Aquincola agrisoli TaxID=3119538 RepID=A0AAW9QCF5_9BURK
MKAWIQRTLVGVFGASVLFGGLAACSHRFEGHGGWAQHSPEDRAKHRARMVERVAAKLELDAAQKAKLDTLASTLQAQRQAVMGGTTHPRAEMQALVAGSTFDRARAQSLVQEKAQALQAASPAVIAAMADFYDSLRPEQQQKVREFMARRGGRGHGPGHGPRG